MYTISGHASMIRDRVRLAAYEEALRRSVRPHSIVLDLGAGTGVMSLLACRFGARRVHAVEPSDVIHVAREIAAANGLADQIVFHQEYSTKLSLPEPADVIVADLRGVLPLFQHNLPALADARRRLLAPGGVLIPRRDVLWSAAVEAPEVYRRGVAVWDENACGFNFDAARRLATNTTEKQHIRAEQCLTAPVPWTTLDYAVRDDPNVAGQIEWTPTRAGTAHGLCLWFDAELVEGVGFSNAPGGPELIYGHAFFPFVQPVALAPGDRIAVTLDARLVGDDYVWRWDTQVSDAVGGAKVRFRQSTLAGTTIAPGTLRQRAADHVPALGAEGEVVRFILSRMDGVQSLEAIARQTAAAFPARFPTWLDALPRVGELSQQYGKPVA
jgi:protein arginine N-methyltransferase 1